MSDIRTFLSLATALGGDRVAVGIDRMMDGLCPDCGEEMHEDGPCYKQSEDEGDE
jgi:hypothetical protein